MRFLSDSNYRRVKSPSKYQALDDLLAIQANFYRSVTGQEYVALEVDALIAAKADRAMDMEPDWARIYSDACEEYEECANTTTEDTSSSTTTTEPSSGTGVAVARETSRPRAMPRSKSTIGSESQKRSAITTVSLTLADEIALDVARRWATPSLPNFEDIAA